MVVTKHPMTVTVKKLLEAHIVPTHPTTMNSVDSSPFIWVELVTYIEFDASTATKELLVKVVLSEL